MRALTRGERQASVGVALGLVALLCVLASSLGLTLYAMAQTKEFRGAVYDRCVARQEFDDATNAARAVQVREWENLAAMESNNPFVDAKLREARVAAYREMAAATKAATAARVRSGCNVYRP